jgi:hypothetical protein
MTPAASSTDAPLTVNRHQDSGATLWLPTEIFDFDINPGADGPSGGIKGGVDMPLAPDL